MRDEKGKVRGYECTLCGKIFLGRFLREPEGHITEKHGEDEDAFNWNRYEDP